MRKGASTYLCWHLGKGLLGMARNERWFSEVLTPKEVADPVGQQSCVDLGCFLPSPIPSL